MTKTILIIDDDNYFHRLMGMILRREGFAIAFAGDGRTGVEMVRTTAPDLVILDYVMPDLDGLEVCRHIRTFSTVSIIFLSALEEEQVRRDALDCGDVYLAKPFQVEELRRQIKALLGAEDDQAEDDQEE